MAAGDLFLSTGVPDWIKPTSYSLSGFLQPDNFRSNRKNCDIERDAIAFQEGDSDPQSHDRYPCPPGL